MSANMADLDSILDSTLDDLSDIPEFKPFPAGAHKVSIKWDFKDINGQMCPELTMVIIETMEMANPEETPAAPGDSTSTAFILKKKDGTKNELAEGQMKAILKSLAESFKTGTNRETIAASNGAECVVVTKVRENKKDPQDVKRYTDIVSLAVI